MTLIILNILIWLGPLLFSLRSGRLNTLHPQFILPIFMIFFILNSHIQDQTNWMDEGNRAIIIGIVKLLPGLDPINFSFEKALIVSLLSGFKTIRCYSKLHKFLFVTIVTVVCLVIWYVTIVHFSPQKLNNVHTYFK